MKLYFSMLVDRARVVMAVRKMSVLIMIRYQVIDLQVIQ